MSYGWGGESTSREEEAQQGRKKQRRGGGSRAGEDQPQQGVSENAKWNSLLCVTILKYIYNDIELAVSWVIPTHAPQKTKKQKEKKKCIRLLYISLATLKKIHVLWAWSVMEHVNNKEFGI